MSRIVTIPIRQRLKRPLRGQSLFFRRHFKHVNLCMWKGGDAFSAQCEETGHMALYTAYIHWCAIWSRTDAASWHQNENFIFKLQDDPHWTHNFQGCELRPRLSFRFHTKQRNDSFACNWPHFLRFSWPFVVCFFLLRPFSVTSYG